ncbi:MAG: STAS domain-containing protein [Actinobacteria bacterium]|nr:MAG: STAS domain-containing protein [Actinomycetota bacterium]
MTARSLPDFEPFAARVASDNGPLVIQARGELDLGTAPRLWDALAGVLDDNHGELVIDLEGVSFMDAQGIKILVRALKHVETNGGKLVLRSPQPPARRVLELTGLDDYLTIEP